MIAGSMLLPQVKKFEYLGVLFMTDRKMEGEMVRWALYWTVVLKRRLSIWYFIRSFSA